MSNGYHHEGIELGVLLLRPKDEKRCFMAPLYKQVGKESIREISGERGGPMSTPSWMKKSIQAFYDYSRPKLEPS